MAKLKKKKTVAKNKVSLMLSGPYDGRYNGKYGEEMEVRELSEFDKRSLFNWLPCVYKNVKQLPIRGWEKFLENSGIIDGAFDAIGVRGDSASDKLWRAKHWRLVENTIYDWLRCRHKNLMSVWGRHVRSK